MHFKFHFANEIVCLSPHECGLCIHLSSFKGLIVYHLHVASLPLEISSYATSWKLYYKNPEYAHVNHVFPYYTRIIKNLKFKKEIGIDYIYNKC